MSCNDFPIGPVSIWTNRSTTVFNHYAISRGVLITSIVKVRLSLKMENSTGDLTLKGAYQLSADCASWGSVTELTGEALTADGESITSSFTDLQSALNGSSKLYIRFGGKVVNTSSTGLEMARASFRLDIRRC